MFGIKKSVITCYDRLVDREPEGHSRWLNPISDIERGVEVGVAGISAGVAKEKSFVSRSDFSAQATSLACVRWVNIDDRTSLLQSFVLDKILQLSESPRMQLPVELLSLVGTNVFYSFQSYDVSTPQTIYNLSTNPMVLAPHKTCPSAREFLEMSIGRLRASALQSGNISLMPNHLRDYAPIKFAIGSDGKMLYTDIDAENTPVLDRVYRWSDVFGKAQPEEHPVFPVRPKNAFIDFPTDVFFCVFGNRNIEFLAAFDCRKAKDSVLERETSWRVVSHGVFSDCRFALGTLDNTTRLLDARNGELGFKSEHSQLFVNERVQFNIVSYSFLPCGIYAKLQPFAIYYYGLQNNIIMRNFDIDCHPAQHNVSIIEDALKPRGTRSSDKIFQSLPPTDCVGILEAS